MLLAYAAYSIPTFHRISKHIWLGYGALICGGAGLVTGWGRHKIKAIRRIMFFLHSVPSYAAVIFAGIIHNFLKSNCFY